MRRAVKERVRWVIVLPVATFHHGPTSSLSFFRLFVNQFENLNSIIFISKYITVLSERRLLAQGNSFALLASIRASSVTDEMARFGVEKYNKDGKMPGAHQLVDAGRGL